MADIDVKIPEGARVIVLPLDDSQHSQRAVHWYLENLKIPERDFVLLVHIVQPTYPSLSSGNVIDTEKVDVEGCHKAMEAGTRRGKSICDKFYDGVVSNGCRGARLLYVDNNAGQAIVKIGEKYHANVIVIGSRGMGLLKRTLIGSVSTYVVHHANIPVIVVPPEK